MSAPLAGTTVVGTLVVLLTVAALGLAAGAVKVRGVGLSTAGVLFAGLLFGHLGVKVDERVLDFVREFGLILFVFSIGLQVGRGFFASLRRQGLKLNLLAASVVVLGVAVALAAHFAGKVPLPAVAGILSGATTNTPSLAAAQQALAEAVGGDPARGALDAQVSGVGYAMAYPFGVVGIIVAMLGLRAAFRIDVVHEQSVLDRAMRSASQPPARANLEVTNPNLAGLPLSRIPLLSSSGVVISRILRNGAVEVAQPETTLEIGDVLTAIGSRKALDNLRILVGHESTVDLAEAPGPLMTKRIIVTRKAVLGKSLAELDFVHRFRVQITRIARSEVEMAASGGLELLYGDTVLAVGAPGDIRKVAEELGDSPRDLNYPHLVPIFVGIVAGVVLGSWPVSLPGVPVPVKLGLAGGPLLVALLAGRLGRLGPLVWYLPLSANFVLRELGISLFLAAVGLKAGSGFVRTMVHGPGLTWMAWGAAITLVPIVLVGAGARLLFRTNYLTLCGVLAGSMTDPPALAFATSVAGSDAPSLGYVTVYPLTMILRILSAQLLVVFLAR